MLRISSYSGGGPSKTATEPMCMWLFSSSMWRKEASSGLIRSMSGTPLPLVVQCREPVAQLGLAQPTPHRLTHRAHDARRTLRIHRLHRRSHRLELLGAGLDDDHRGAPAAQEHHLLGELEAAGG